MQDFYRLEPGVQLQMANAVAANACHKLVQDMNYEARIAAVITYKGDTENVKVTKEEARNMFLTREEFIKVNMQLHLIFKS